MQSAKNRKQKVFTTTTRGHAGCADNDSTNPKPKAGEADTTTNTTTKPKTFFTDKLLQMQQCWSCPNDQTPSKQFFCNSCGVLQHPFVPMGNQDYFSLYNLPVSYDIDIQQLEQGFRKLQQTIHPDLFQSKTEKEHEYSMEYSMNINHSYQILKDPLLRAKYIIYLFHPDLIVNDENYSEFSHLQVSGDDSQQQQQQQQMGKQCGKTSANKTNAMGMSAATNTRIDMMTLMEIFERRTQIADTFDGQELYTMYNENEVAKEGIFAKLSTLLKNKDFENALTQCELLGYYNSMQRELKTRIPPKFFTNNNPPQEDAGPIQL